MQLVRSGTVTEDKVQKLDFDFLDKKIVGVFKLFKRGEIIIAYSDGHIQRSKDWE